MLIALVPAARRSRRQEDGWAGSRVPEGAHVQGLPGERVQISMPGMTVGLHGWLGGQGVVWQGTRIQAPRSLVSAPPAAFWQELQQELAEVRSMQQRYCQRHDVDGDHLERRGRREVLGKYSRPVAKPSRAI